MNVHMRWNKYVSGSLFFVFLSLFFGAVQDLRAEETPEEEMKRLLALREEFLSEYRKQAARVYNFSISNSHRFPKKRFFPVCSSSSPFYQTGAIKFSQDGVTYYVVRSDARDRRAARSASTKNVFDMPDDFFPMSYLQQGKNHVLLVENCNKLRLKQFYEINIFLPLDDRISELRKKVEFEQAPAFESQNSGPARNTPAKADPRPPAYQKKVITLPGNVNLEMIKVNAGTFLMGSPLEEAGRSRDEQQHKVTITEDYWIGRYEVTQAQYEAVMGHNPSESEGKYFPVTNVSYDDAVAFCEKLNRITDGRRPKGHIYALPTEAQWEFAARGGVYSKKYCVYSGGDNIHDVAWFKENASSVHEVGDKQPNEQGLYDMSGNVWEWVRDMYKPYTADPEVDPDNRDGTLHVSRGGGFAWYPAGCRAASRNKDQNIRRDCGFRIALVRSFSISSFGTTRDRDADAGQTPAGGYESSEGETGGDDPTPASKRSRAKNNVEKSKTQLNRALVYLKRGMKSGEDDRKNAVKYARKAAEAGLDDAQWLLGLCYLNGIGIEKDPREAVVWLQKAAEQGNVKALKSLAGCYFQGVGVEKNAEEAIRLLGKAADGNNADAQYVLGCCYASGSDVEKDVGKARYWLQKAAENGHREAKEKLLDLPEENEKDE